jgi:hypothetical protein
MSETPRQRLQSRLAQLKRERALWEQQWRNLARYILPNRTRFWRYELNRGEIQGDEIINNTPLLAARILASGMMAGITSPSRTWFRLTTSDPDLADLGPVRRYLHVCEERLKWIFAKSNFYKALADGVYPDIGVFGTALMMVEPDPRTVLRFYPEPIGEYYLAANAQGEIDTVLRRLPMTVRQIVQKFGLEQCSPMVKKQFENGQLEQSVDVIHAVEPNSDFDPKLSLSPDHKRWRSWWFEEGSAEDKFLRQSGFMLFPALVPRWMARQGDVYGRSPGMQVIGDCRALQHLERRLAQLVDKTATPPMKGSEALRAGRASLLPGDMTYVPNGQGHVFEPAMIVPPQAIAALKDDIQRHEQRIERGLFTDLWMRLIRDDRNQRATATEIEEGKQETMLQLGPVLESLNGSLFEPCIDWGLMECDARGMLPPPPQELQGQDVKAEFISVMHQTQKMTGLTAIRTVVQEIGLLAQLGRADALDKLNVDEIADEIANMAGIKPELLLSKDEVQQIRDQREKQAQQQQGMQTALAGAKAAKDVSAVDPQNLQQLAQTVSPVAAAQGGFPQTPPVGGGQA